MSPEHYPSLSGQRVGFFHVLDRAERCTSQGHAQYWCRCDHCGREKLVRAQNLRKGMVGRWEPRCSGCER